MEMGEKIQFYRKANRLTQKQLSDLSGVSEISIRKYEAGDRFPKPEQLKKIASVLEIGGNELLEIELDAVNVETVGDVMTLFYLLKESMLSQRKLLQISLNKGQMVLNARIPNHFLIENLL